MAAPTFQELYDLGKAEALIRRPSMSFKPGDVSDMVLGGAAAVGDRVVGYAADRFKATYIDGARADDLTVLADDHWSITRIPAVKAFGSVTVTRSSATSNPFTLPSGSIVATDRDALGNEIRYLTTQPAVWAGSENGGKTVTAEAESGGPGGNVLAAAITRIISSTSEGSYTVTNASAFVGGAAEESDDELRERIRLFPATIRRGTLAALEYGARQVPGVASATATEDQTAGTVTVYVTDSAGASSGNPVISQPGLTDNGTMTYKVAIELENWRAAGSFVLVQGGTLLLVDANITLTVRAGVDVAQIVSDVVDAVTARMAVLKIGETLYRSALQAVIRNVDSANVLEASVTLRTGANPYLAVDISPSASQIIRAGAVAVA